MTYQEFVTKHKDKLPQLWYISKDGIFPFNEALLRYGYTEDMFYGVYHISWTSLDKAWKNLFRRRLFFPLIQDFYCLTEHWFFIPKDVPQKKRADWKKYQDEMSAMLPTLQTESGLDISKLYVVSPIGCYTFPQFLVFTPGLEENFYLPLSDELIGWNTFWALLDQETYPVYLFEQTEKYVYADVSNDALAGNLFLLVLPYDKGIVADGYVAAEEAFRRAILLPDNELYLLE